MTRGWLSETVTTYLRTPVTSKPGSTIFKYHTLTVEYWGETKQKRFQKHILMADLGFPRGGGANSKGGYEKLLFGQFSPKNCIKFIEFGQDLSMHLGRGVYFLWPIWYGLIGQRCSATGGGVGGGAMSLCSCKKKLLNDVEASSVWLGLIIWISFKEITMRTYQNRRLISKITLIHSWANIPLSMTNFRNQDQLITFKYEVIFPS